MSVPNKFRENRYLNESGSKTGNWFLNRLDFFQFHEYPEYKKHKLISFFAGALTFILSIKIIMLSFLASLPIFYVSYIALKSFYLLHKKVCRHNGDLV